MKRADFADTARFKRGNLIAVEGTSDSAQVYHDRKSGETYLVRVGADLFCVATAPSGVNAPPYGPWQALAS